MNSSSGSAAGPSSGSGDESAPRRNSKRPKCNLTSEIFFLPLFQVYTTGAPSLQTNPHSKMGNLYLLYCFACIWPDRCCREETRQSNLMLDRVGDLCFHTCWRHLRPHRHRRAYGLQQRMLNVVDTTEFLFISESRYVKSRNDAQLKDADKANKTSGCDPEKTTKDGSPIVPCGLIAWSLFNDTYNFTLGNQNLSVNKNGISWKSDRDHKFGKDVYPKNFQNGTLRGGANLDPNKSVRLHFIIPCFSLASYFVSVCLVCLNEQENLIVWMRTAALPTFRKLYGKIHQDLKANDTIMVTLENNYNTYSFNGKKKLVLSTSSWLGGKNDFLGIAYVTIGGLCFFLATAFTVVYLVKPRYT
ncbi:hypothetical protein BHM03_00056083, partial [Ensete ventricosum]